MKKIKFIILQQLIAFILLSGLVACNDFLEVIPQDQVSDGTLWESTENADLFLNSIYGALPGPYSSADPWENFSDNAINGVAGRYSTTTYANSVYTPSNGPSQWANYNHIRKCNLFIERVNSSTLAEEWKRLRLAETRFLRAYFYTLLWTHHGGVPIITDVLNQNTQGDAIFRERNTSEETFKFITDECSAIADDLPLNAQNGRVSKGAALTLKGWCELFNASPLHNPENNKEKWALAATTNRMVMDLGKYSLFSDYGRLFLEENNYNQESIFDKAYLGGTGLGNLRTAYHGPSFVGGVLVGFGLCVPTQEMINEYAMADGKLISDSDSGYDDQAPYENREKRFYESIIYDGAEWLGTEIVMKQGLGSRNATDLSDRDESTNTGYYWRKGMNPLYASVNNNQNSANYMIFRYAEVLLSYAEAQNEAVGPDESVYNAVNLVRERGELPPLPEGLTQAQMRAAIHRERRVELAFEEKRWYDLIRLKLAEEKLNGHLHAIVIEQQNGGWVYRETPAPGGARIFYAEKNYFFPIPQSAIDRNSKLVQNPNY